jgi:NAD(P)-dependent dehydrogenase (short-subunit alcohol dehydrogenase family)
MLLTQCSLPLLTTIFSPGIGKAICHKLLADYPDVHVLLASRNASRGQAAVADIIQAVGGTSKDRLELIVMDTSSDASVTEAAATIAAALDGDNNGQTTLYGIINNAGIYSGSSQQEVVNTNYYGPKRVFEALGPLLQRPGGRLVNVASASGPNFVASLPRNDGNDDDDSLYQKLKAPWTIRGGVKELDRIAETYKSDNHYGFSKALVNAYTYLVAHANAQAAQTPDVIINSVTPGWIATDMTAGMGATNPASQGAVPPVWLLMSPDLETVPSGRYYGSDCVRSPFHVYRGPGDAPYDGPDGA